jgi:type I restriction enzyme M protein
MRGDGKSGIHNENCFTSANFPMGRATVALLNPPFPHKGKTSTPISTFIDRGLEGLQTGGLLLAIVPNNVLFGKACQLCCAIVAAASC